MSLVRATTLLIASGAFWAAARRQKLKLKLDVGNQGSEVGGSNTQVAGTTTWIAGVPVHNLHLAALQKGDVKFSHLREGEADYVLFLKKNELDVCQEYKECVAHGHSSLPFLAFRGTEAALEAFVKKRRDKLEMVEPSLRFGSIPDATSKSSRGSVTGTWGLRRVRSRDPASMLVADSSATDAGRGVHVYILDTGIRTSHADFGGRAVPTLQVNVNFTVEECKGDAQCATDQHGHGTHCAGTVGGTSFGIAKAALLHAVKVLDDDGLGNTIGVVESMAWVAENAAKPAVVSMSLSGQRSVVTNDAVDRLVQTGIVVVTAAGNENADACKWSPGSAQGAINVGATSDADERASFSNYGPCLTMWAPGEDVLSASSSGDALSKLYSGTSMACPFVSGAAALLLGVAPSEPGSVREKLIAAATAGKLEGSKSDSPNLLLFTDFDSPQQVDSSREKAWREQALGAKPSVAEDAPSSPATYEVAARKHKG